MAGAELGEVAIGLTKEGGSGDEEGKGAEGEDEAESGEESVVSDVCCWCVGGGFAEVVPETMAALV